MVEKVEFVKGIVIFKKGQWQMKMFDIISGKVGIYANYGEPNQKLLTEYGPGKIFGEMGVIEALPRSATAVALENTECNAIDGDAFADYFKNDPDRIISIMQNLSGRLRELSNEYLDVCKTIGEYLAQEDVPVEKKTGLLDKIKNILSKRKNLEG